MSKYYVLQINSFKRIRILTAAVLILLSFGIRAQCKSEPNLIDDMFLQVNGGIQFSGARKPDVVISNFTEVYSVGIGRNISTSFKFLIGIEGKRFLTIMDDYDHNYNYLFGSNIIKFSNNESFISNLELILGSGLFINYVYQRPNICAHLGLLYSKEFSDALSLSFGVKAIVGWDIYQGDDDVLNSLNVGLIKFF